MSKKAKSTNTMGLGVTSIFNSRSSLTMSINKFIEENKIRTGFVHFWLGPKLCLLAVDPESAKFVLKTTTFHKVNFLVGEKFFKNFGKNLVTLNGEEWRHHRTIINSGFNNKAYASYFSIFVETAEKALSVISQTLNADIDCRAFFSKFTLDLLGKSIFHHDFKQLDNIDDIYFHAYKKVLRSSFTYLGVILSIFPWIEKFPIKPIKELHQAIDLLITLFHSIIKEKQERKGNQGDVLDHLIDTTSGLSHVELLSEVWIFFLAGHETTGTALTWASVCLAHYPEFQEKLFQEINLKLGNRIPTLDELSQMEYLDCFISEVLRLHPPLRLITTRIATEDVTYEKYFIPKGTRIGLCIEAIHKNPDFWPDPEKFDPDRFLPENKKGRNHFAFLPFSLGQRQCLGYAFSLIEQKLFLTMLLQRYKVVSPVAHTPHDISLQLITSESQQCYIHLEKRI